MARVLRRCVESVVGVVCGVLSLGRKAQRRLRSDKEQPRDNMEDGPKDTITTRSDIVQGVCRISFSCCSTMTTERSLWAPHFES
jgi:hypothetical protein